LIVATGASRSLGFEGVQELQRQRSPHRSGDIDSAMRLDTDAICTVFR
jgi:hypothetical protein